MRCGVYTWGICFTLYEVPQEGQSRAELFTCVRFRDGLVFLLLAYEPPDLNVLSKLYFSRGVSCPLNGSQPTTSISVHLRTT